MRYRVLLGFGVGVRSDLFSYGGLQLTVCGSRLTCFKRIDRLTRFCVSGGGRN